MNTKFIMMAVVLVALFSVGEFAANVDECFTEQHNCNNNAQCIDTAESFICQCFSGFEGDGTTSCTDVNECVTDQHNCNDNAECINTVGSFNCQCSSGFEGDGITCTAI